MNQAATPLPPAKGAHLVDAILTAYGRAFEHPGKIRLVRGLVRALAGGRIKIRHVGGTVIAVDPGDYIGWAIFRTGSYEPASLALALKIMTADPGLFVDVGANFGWYTCAVASIAGTNVIGIEPDPENCAALRANIDGNGLRTVAVFHGAVGAQPALLPMSRRSAGNSGTVAVAAGRPAPGSGGYWAGSTTLQNLLNALVQPPARPVLIKIDVEGFEPEVLDGLDFAGPFRPKNILIECDRVLGVAAWGSYEKFTAFFTQRGYEVLDVTGRPFTGDGPFLEENAWARDRDQARGAMPPRVSIVIPCRNGAAWLGEAIESCLGQSWANLQIIVVDNGSTDGSLDLAKRYEARAVAVLTCERAGASAARNVGLKHADGDLIQFLDADDMLDADKIRRQVERLDASPASAVASGAWAHFAHDPSEAVFTAEAVWRDFAPVDFLIASWLGGGMMPNFAWLTPRAVIERAGPWNESISVYDDGEFFCRVVLASSGIAFCADARGYYRAAGAPTLSKRRDGGALASAFTAVDLSCRHLLQRCNAAAALKACATHYQRFAYDAYPHATELVAQAEKRAVELGGSDLRPGGGPAFQMLARGLGWKLGKRAQQAWRTLRGRAAPG